MKKINDGGAAFPFAATDPSNVERQTNGMTLRDWFAGQALVGIIASGEFISPDGLWCGNGAPPTADAAYLLADAMLAARGADVLPTRRFADDDSERMREILRQQSKVNTLRPARPKGQD